MYTAHSDPPTPAAPTSPSTGRFAYRILPMLGGGLLAVVGVVVAVAGGATLAIFGSDGAASSGSHDLSTRTAALVSPTADISDTNDVSDVVGDASVRVSAEATGGKPVFVGLARKADVDRYLAGTAVSVIDDADVHPFKLARHVRNPSGAATVASGQPGDQPFWVERSTSTGTASVDWKVRDGEYRAVVMNADGTPGVSSDGSFRVKIQHLGAVAGVAIGGGLLLLVAGSLVMFTVGRDPRHTNRHATAAPAPVTA